MKQYVIRCRYQHRAHEGVVWTDWFVWESNYIPEDRIKEALKAARDDSAQTDKITKLKHEYEAYPAEQYEIDCIETQKRVEAAKADFATIKRMKKPWLAKARKERKKLLEMSNDEKVQHLANKRQQMK